MAHHIDTTLVQMIRRVCKQKSKLWQHRLAIFAYVAQWSTSVSIFPGKPKESPE